MVGCAGDSHVFMQGLKIVLFNDAAGLGMFRLQTDSQALGLAEFGGG